MKRKLIVRHFCPYFHVSTRTFRKILPANVLGHLWEKVHSHIWTTGISWERQSSRSQLWTRWTPSQLRNNFMSMVSLIQIQVNFIQKSNFVIVLSFFSATSITVPRVYFHEYAKGTWQLSLIDWIRFRASLVPARGMVGEPPSDTAKWSMVR